MRTLNARMYKNYGETAAKEKKNEKDQAPQIVKNQ